MAEGGEGSPVNIKPREMVALQGLAQTVVLGERRPGLPALNDIDRRRMESARRLSDMGQWNKSLEAMAGDGHALGENLRRVVDKFGTDRRPDGTKQRRGAELARYTRAENSLNGIIPILESESFDQMPAAEQNRLRGLVDTALRANAKLPDFQLLTAAQQGAIIDRFLRDPKLKAEMIAELKLIQGMTLSQEKDVLSARNEIATTIAKGTETGRRATQANAAAANLEQRLQNLHNPNQQPSQRQIDLAQAVTDAQSEVVDARGITTNLQTDMLRARATLQRAILNAGNVRGPQLAMQVATEQDAYDEASALFKAAQETQKNWEKDLATARQDLRQATTPTADHSEEHEDNLENRLEDRRNKASEARIEAAGANGDTTIKRVEAEELAEERALEEEAIAGRLEGIFERSVDRYITNELNSSLDVLVGQEGKVQDDAIKAVSTELRRNLETRWGQYQNRPRGLFRRSRREYVTNRVQVNRDFDRLLAQGDDVLMRDILARLRPADPTGVRTALTPDQIRNLMENETFASGMRSEVVKQVIARRGRISRFRPGETQQMMEMQNVQGSVESSLEHNAEYRKQIEALTQSDDMDMDNPAFRSRFSRIAASRPGLLLFPLTTVPWVLWSAGRARWQSRNRNDRDVLAEHV